MESASGYWRDGRAGRQVLRWLADENFNNDILRGLLRRNSRLDIVRAQDVGLSGSTDAAILAWASNENRVLLTHDVRTLTAHAYARMHRGEPMPGVFEVSRSVPIASVIEDILLLTECSLLDEWKGQVRYLPLR